MNKTAFVRAGFQVLLVFLVLVCLGTTLLMHREVEALRVIPGDQDLTSLFGDGVTGYTPLGSRQGYIVLDQHAFFHDGDRVLLNQTYLDDHGLYPLQGRTVRLVRKVSLGLVLLMVLVGAFFFKSEPEPVNTRRTEKHPT